MHLQYIRVLVVEMFVSFCTKENLSWRAERQSRNSYVPKSEGLITEKILYEISKSWDCAKDFRISGKISRFQEKFQDFMEISRFHLRFQDFRKDFKISWRFQDFT